MKVEFVAVLMQIEELGLVVTGRAHFSVEGVNGGGTHSLEREF
jgi:hypothetical protein